MYNNKGEQQHIRTTYKANNNTYMQHHQIANHKNAKRKAQNENRKIQNTPHKTHNHTKTTTRKMLNTQRRH